MRRVKVKICGITRKKDLITSVNAGADALGFVVNAPSSPRSLTMEKAGKLMRQTPIFIDKVAVTVPNSLDILIRVYERLKPSSIQIHGSAQLNGVAIREKLGGVNLIRAISVNSNKAIRNAVEVSKSFDAVLVDSFTRGKHGGTGVVHDWRLSKSIRQAIKPKPLILAGGLKPENVIDAIRLVQPYAVDVSSGVESRPGVKDPRKVYEFVEKAKEVKL
jgi:phosphoribosylanthranilate isomerase